MTPVVRTDDTVALWYAMRDLKRANAKLPAYVLLRNAGVNVFTPMTWRITVKGDKRVRCEVPAIHDLLFAHESRNVLDPIVESVPTLQYRYRKGGNYREPMTVPEKDMERFIRAVESSDKPPRYYLPDEIRPEMCRHRIRIVGGTLDGYEGRLLSVRGSKTKRLLVELPEFFAVGVEVTPDMIEFI